MNRDQFIRERESDWRRFESLLKRMQTNHQVKLDGDEITEFSALYRAICFDMSLVQSRDWGTSMTRYLNDLATRGHNCLYRSPRGSLRSIISFIAADFPRLLRQNAAYFWVAFVLSVVPGLICGIVVANDPSLAGRILSNGQQAQMEMMYEDSMGDSEQEAVGAMAGFYVRNNVGISFQCFALGAFAGIGTMNVLIFNSIYIGTVTGYLIGKGHSANFFEFVIGHGSFELTAIVISGTAGLMIGHAIVHPGTQTRWDALKTRGPDAVKIALGAAIMLCIAAIIEGFWSPSAVPVNIKFIVGSGLWVFVILYLTLGGRNFKHQPVQT